MTLRCPLALAHAASLAALAGCAAAPSLAPAPRSVSGTVHAQELRRTGARNRVEHAAFDDELDDLDDLVLIGEPASGTPDDDSTGDDLLDDFGLDELLLGDVPEPVATSNSTSNDDPLRDWKGYVEARPRVYFDDRGGPKNDEQFLLEAEFELDFRFSESVTGYFRPRAFVDAVDGELRRFEPFEAYLTHSASTWDLRGGQFVENWGIVDTYNPIDVVNRRDLGSDFLDPDRLGELGARYRRFFAGGSVIGEPTLALYALPTWRPTLFAPRDQRFGFGSPDAPFEPEAGFEPSGSERGFYAARFTSTVSTGPVNADAQFVVARGPERTPAVVAGRGTSGVLAPAYFGATTIGAGFRAVPNQDAAGRFLSTLTLKAEVVYKDPYSFDASPLATPDDYVAYVVGVDRQFYDLFRSQDTLTMTVEYAGEEGATDLASTFRPFRNDAILRAFWERGDFARTSFETRGIYDFDTEEVIVESLFERQLRGLHEDLKLTVQLQYFDPPGTGASLFDFFPNNTSLAVGLRWDL